MNPWTALLESLHSALIDELTERAREPKPVLGMPIRKTHWTVPSTHAGQILVVEITQKIANNSPPVSGFACLTLDKACAQNLRTDAQQLWAALLKRAGTEFNRRQIQPLVSQAMLTDAKDGLPASLTATAQRPSRVIWIPIAAGGGQVFLGLGI